VLCPIYHPFVLFIPAMSSAHSLAFCGVLCPIYHPFVLFIPAIYGFCSRILITSFVVSSNFSHHFPTYGETEQIALKDSKTKMLTNNLYCLSYLFLPFTASAHSLAFCGVLCPIYHPFVLFIPAIYAFCLLVSFLRTKHYTKS
jgi:hypothetical protein